MNYKKIIVSRRLRFAVLKMLSFVPDSLMVRIQYFIKLHRWPNLRHPQRFTEKLQWYKLHYRNPLMGQCVDKYLVRNYIEAKGYKNILNELYGVYEDISHVDLSALPKKFVMKKSDGLGAGNYVLLCKDKDELDTVAIRRILETWQRESRINPGREWAYNACQKSYIVVEKFIESDIENGGLIDYKFLCFNGRCQYVYVIADREMGDKCGLNIYTRDFVKIDAYRSDEKRLDRDILKPDNYLEMLSIAEDLAHDFLHVRVDLYSVHHHIIFGELTFYDGSGYQSYTPDSFDFELGKDWII